MDNIIQLLKYFYKELIVLAIILFFFLRFLNKQSKKKKVVIEDTVEEQSFAENRNDIPREKLIGILLIGVSVIILVLVMYYLMPVLLDNILPKDN
jgi:hypothetical protein